MALGRRDHDERAAGRQHARDLGPVARGEDVEDHVGRAAGERQRLPDVARDRGDPAVGAGGPAQRGRRGVQRDADRAGQRVQRRREVVPGAGPEVDDERRASSRLAAPPPPRRPPPARSGPRPGTPLAPRPSPPCPRGPPRAAAAATRSPGARCRSGGRAHTPAPVRPRPAARRTRGSGAGRRPRPARSTRADRRRDGLGAVRAREQHEPLRAPQGAGRHAHADHGRAGVGELVGAAERPRASSPRRGRSAARWSAR